MNRQLIIFLALFLLLVACQNGDKDYDATGIFEATEITVSAEQAGTLLHFPAEEGDPVGNGQQVALIDTTQLYLQYLQLGATRSVYASQRPETQKQIAALRQQIDKAQKERERFARLVSEGAANRKQVDDLESQVLVLQKELDARLSSLGNSTRSLTEQMNTAELQRMQVADLLDKCHVRSPVKGTILAKYSEAGEYAVPGKPLFKVADLETMYLRAYITSSQLQKVNVGDSVRVYADYGGGDRKTYAGQITWISSQAEFTPKTILTEEERADLVYAVKIRVRNDGAIKIGMYGEVQLNASDDESR